MDLNNLPSLPAATPDDEVLIRDKTDTTDVPDGSDKFTSVRGLAKGVIPAQAEPPANPVVDDLWYDTDEEAIKRWNGSGWATKTDYSPAVSPPSGNYYQANARSNASMGLTLDRLFLLPVEFLPGHTYTSLAVRVLAASTDIGAVVRMGLYERGRSGVVGSLLLDAGTTDVQVSVGVKTIPISYTTSSPYGYLAIVGQVGTTSLTIACVNNNGIVPGAGLYLVSNGESQGYWYQDAVTGALPSSLTPVTGSWPVPVGYYR